MVSWVGEDAIIREALIVNNCDSVELAMDVPSNPQVRHQDTHDVPDTTTKKVITLFEQTWESHTKAI